MNCIANTIAFVLGNDHSGVKRAVQVFAGPYRFQQALNLATPAKYESVKQLISLLPGALRDRGGIQFRGPTDVPAVAAALEPTRHCTGRAGILAFKGGCSGMTASALAAMGDLRSKFDQGLRGVHFPPCSYAFVYPFGTDGSRTDQLSLDHMTGGRHGAVLCSLPTLIPGEIEMGAVFDKFESAPRSALQAAPCGGMSNVAKPHLLASSVRRVSGACRHHGIGAGVPAWLSGRAEGSQQTMGQDGETVPRTMLEVLTQRVMQDPQRLAFRYLDRRGRVQESSRAHLLRHAEHVALRLVSMGATGQRVLLACADAATFVPGFYGCLMAGAVAVPTPAGANRRLAERTALLAKDAQPVVLVCDTDAMAAVAAKIGLPVLDLRAEALPGADAPLLPVTTFASPGASDLAFIQYSSGSTGDPKGVMVTHGNVLANCRTLTEAMACNRNSRMLTTVPLFHDMGLVAGILWPLCCDGESTLLDPLQVIQSPQTWLAAISQYRITHSGGPNFLYELALGVADGLDEAIDLTSWKFAYCGAEPVRAGTVQRFCRRFDAFGFASSSFYPCYGLAESTLFVSGMAAGCGPAFDAELPPSARTSCGRSHGDTEFAIVDPETLARQPDGREGEIWVRGSSVAAGYWARQSLTVEVFNGRTVQGEGPFLRTGDMGIVKSTGLHVTGRLKDLIIINGRNVAPQDVELEVDRAHSAIQRSVAFAHASGEIETLIVVAEVGRDCLRDAALKQAVCEAAVQAVMSACQTQPAAVELVPPATIPRTSSGKLRRSQTREDWGAGRLRGTAAAAGNGAERLQFPGP